MIGGVAEEMAARLQFIMFSRRVFDLLEHFRDGSHQPVAVIVVPHGNGDGQGDAGIFLDVKIIGGGDVAGRVFQVEN